VAPVSGPKIGPILGTMYESGIKKRDHFSPPKAGPLSDPGNHFLAPHRAPM